MYEVDVTEQVLNDLYRFNQNEVEEVLATLFGLQVEPKPPGVEVIPKQQAADGIMYRYVTDLCVIQYHIYESAKLVQILTIDRRQHLN